MPDPRKQRIADCVGSNLREMRHLKGVSQEILAKRIGLHFSEIGLIERGRRVPRIDTLARIADGLGVEPAELLDGVDRALRGFTPSRLLDE